MSKSTNSVKQAYTAKRGLPMLFLVGYIGDVFRRDLFPGYTSSGGIFAVKTRDCADFFDLDRRTGREVNQTPAVRLNRKLDS